MLLFVADGVVGLNNSIAKYFPKAKLQRCLVHVIRNLTHKVRVSDRKLISNEFRDVRQSASLSEAKESLSRFIETWGHKYSFVRKLADIDDLFAYFSFPKAIRGSIYSTNVIESFNDYFKANIKKKQRFPNEESLDRYAGVQCLDYNNRNLGRIHKGFGVCQDTLESMFD